MNESWKAREFECDSEKWTVVRHVRAESDTNVAGDSPSTKQTGLYFNNHVTARVLAFTRGALPTGADIRTMSDDALCALLRRSTPCR